MKIDYTALGKRIAKRRKELGLKQYEVCELIDVNYKYLSTPMTDEHKRLISGMIQLITEIENN